MPSWIAWLVAGISTAAFISLWFWEARRVLQTRKSMVESAAGQLALCRKRESGVKAEHSEVLRRCESIYRQAAEHYNAALARPWIYLPGKLQGFQKEPGGQR